MRLIDADKLHEAIDTETYRHTYIEQIHDIIDNAPTIDAVPREKYERLLEAANEMDKALKWYQEEEDRRLSEID